MLQVNVARLHDDNREALSLAWIAGREGGTTVRREAAQAASLIGHLNLTHPNSIQVIGAYEAGMVAGFIERLFESRPAAIIVADGVKPPAALVDAATRAHTPLFASPLPAPLHAVPWCRPPGPRSRLGTAPHGCRHAAARR